MFGETLKKLVIEETGEVLADKIETADSFWSRFRGLMFRRDFAEGEGILFELSEPREFGVHTFFLFFSIDLVYLDGDLEILETKEKLSPWSTYTPETPASYLLEIPAGTIEKKDITTGDKLEIIQE
uniref:Protein containing DUF192 n=1 Tax=uncultured organism TaxID=155900 RepID=M1PPP7_9ZZZZ|nr:protein containing DUF192 [uncultured organism]